MRKRLLLIALVITTLMSLTGFAAAQDNVSLIFWSTEVEPSRAAMAKWAMT